MYASLLGISGALYLSVFEQPVSSVFFGILLGLTGVFRGLPASGGAKGDQGSEFRIRRDA